MKEFLKYCLKKTLTFGLHIFWIFSICNNKILFINEHSYSFSDNLKYLSLYLIEKDQKKYRIYFSLKDKTDIGDLPIKSVNIFSLKHFYHALTSSVLITNAGGISYLPLRRKQLVISTWHGGGPYKVSGVSAIHGYWYEKETEYNAKKVDYILSSCRVFTEEEAPGMYYKPDQIINCGMPRMDFFFNNDAMGLIHDKVYRSFDIPEQAKFVIYMPTFRGIFEDYQGVITDDMLEIDCQRLLSALRKRFGGEWKFAIRLHPRLRDAKFKNNSLINMSYYPDAEELLMAADVLVTDYSSVMWDFSFSKKPVFLFATDINDYQVKRGFYIPPDEWPFPLASTNDEMVENIRNFEYESYQKRVEAHHEAVGSYEIGKACQTVKSKIDEHIKKLEQKLTQ